MSLHRLKTLYCIAVIALGIILAVVGGIVGWIAAILILGGALPGWGVAERIFLAQAFDQAATFLEGLQLAGGASQQPDPIPQASHSQTRHSDQG